VNKIDSPSLLFWEDEAAGSGRWWIARAREIVPDGRIDYFIAEDDLTATLVAVALVPRARNYRVIAVAPFGDVGLVAALQSLKVAASESRGAVAESKAGGNKVSPILHWRLARAACLVRRDLPLAVAGVGGGAALGFAIAFVAASSRFSGWPLMSAGLVVGALAGPAFKFLVDRNVGEDYPRPWARFAVVTFAAIAGAIAAAGVTLTMQWS
jgi:hypothetical protein